MALRARTNHCAALRHILHRRKVADCLFRRQERRLSSFACSFVGAASELDDCDAINPDGLPEIAFAGRSNVGKSSLLNAIMGRANMVRVSKKPGQTRGVNFFRMDRPEAAFLVDLPGYGFAKVGSKVDRKEVEDRAVGYALGRDHWIRSIVFVLVDARRGLMDVDREVLSSFDKHGVHSAVVLTKIDALRSIDALRNISRSVQADLTDFVAVDTRIQYVSAHKKIGVVDVRRRILHAARSRCGGDG